MSDTPGFEAGAYLRVGGGPWYKTMMRIVSVDSASTMTVRWEWWCEPWFQIPVIFALIWANYLVWDGF